MKNKKPKSHLLVTALYLIAIAFGFARALEYAASPETNIALDRAQAAVSRPR